MESFLKAAAHLRAAGKNGVAGTNFRSLKRAIVNSDLVDHTFEERITAVPRGPDGQRRGVQGAGQAALAGLAVPEIRIQIVVTPFELQLAVADDRELLQLEGEPSEQEQLS